MFLVDTYYQQLFTGIDGGLDVLAAALHLADGFTRRHLLVVVGVLHIAKRDAICPVPVRLDILC